MSTTEFSAPADVLINAAVKMVGKREFLKAVEKLYGITKSTVEKVRNKSEVPVEEQCVARTKGDRTGMKVGRYVLFDNLRCSRGQVSDSLCAIHCNQVTKFGTLPLGKASEPLTDELKKVFGEI
jgi:hypothetical protein